MIIHDEAQCHLFGKLRQRFTSTAEDGAGSFVINALEIIEEMRSGDAAFYPEARSIRYRAVRDESDSPVIIPNSFVVRRFRRAQGRKAGQQDGRTHADCRVRSKHQAAILPHEQSLPLNLRTENPIDV